MFPNIRRMKFQTGLQVMQYTTDMYNVDVGF